jgi:hypothetical protein
MYVNPFAMGVFTTIVIEIVACVVWGIIIANSGGKK